MEHDKYKFRAWMADTDEYLYFSLFDLDLGYHVVKSRSLDGCEIDQSTLERDKNNVELYAGDIIKTVWNGVEQNAIIQFICGHFTAVIISSSDPEFTHFTNGKGMHPMWWSKFSEKIGTKFENPELLK